MNAWLRHSGALVAALLAIPAVAGAALLRPPWRRGFLERLGAAGTAPSEPQPLWIHAASVGEVRAALRLCDALRERAVPLIVSTTTPTGRDVLERARPDVAARFAPLDHPWTTAAALRRTKPRALVMVETELWPAWIAAASRAGIPVAIVSARLSDRSLPRYRRIAALLRPTWSRIAAIGARSDDDAARFASLGVPETRIYVTGDLKFDPPAQIPELAADLETFVAGTTLLLGASTHPGEHRTLLEAFGKVAASQPGTALVLAPRHLAAVNALVADAAEFSLPVHLRSRLGSAASDSLRGGELLILDTLGELAGLYARAAGVFVGGSLVPIGGHNVLEPLWAECPVAFGPHTQNVSEAARVLLATGAAHRVNDSAELAAQFSRWLAVPSTPQSPAVASVQRAALDAMRVHRGSTQRSVELIVSLADAGSG